MSLLFWRKTQDEGTQAPSVAVTETTPLPVQLIHPDDNDIPPVKIEQEYLPPVEGVSADYLVDVPGTSTGMYAAGDALGTLITIPNAFRADKNSGIVTKILYLDRDDEGSEVDVTFWSVGMTTTADNAPFAPTDIDLLSTQGFEQITIFQNWANNQVGQWEGAHWVRSQDTNLYIRLTTQGTPTIAAGSEPLLLITVVPD